MALMGNLLMMLCSCAVNEAHRGPIPCQVTAYDGSKRLQR
jgi:hypothetical protein